MGKIDLFKKCSQQHSTFCIAYPADHGQVGVGGKRAGRGKMGQGREERNRQVGSRINSTRATNFLTPFLGLILQCGYTQIYVSYFAITGPCRPHHHPTAVVRFSTRTYFLE